MQRAPKIPQSLNQQAAGAGEEGEQREPRALWVRLRTGAATVGNEGSSETSKQSCLTIHQAHFCVCTPRKDIKKICGPQLTAALFTADEICLKATQVPIDS